MENAPLNPAAGDSDKKPGSKKKKKHAEALGLFAMDSGSPPLKDKTEHIWDKLTFTKRKSGESQPAVPLSEALEAAGAGRLPEVTEAEAESATLSEPETRFVERSIVEARQQAEPLPDGGPAEDVEAAAVELFRTKVVAAGKPAEQAFEETLQDLTATGPRAAEPAREADRPTAAGRPPEAAAVSERPESSQPTPPEIAAPQTETPVSEIAAEEDKTDPEAAAPAGPTLPPPPAPHAAAGGNYFSPPPVPETAKRAGVQKEVVPYYNNEDLVGAAFLGGLVGYLIGRRRGRIKTERKLKPIQKKLEQQIEGVRRDIAFKEAHIRKMARQQAREQQQSHHREHNREQTARHDQRRIEALEASQLHGKKVAPERIGRVLVTAGERPQFQPPKPEKPEKAEKTRPPIKPVDKRVETMSRAELLNLSEKAAVENTTLRQVYETHLVGEQGLRRLVSEYVRGGDVQKALREELVEHEIDFERDPVLRDRKRPVEQPDGPDSQTLDSLLQKAGVFDQTEVREELATLKVRQARQEQQHHQQQKRRRVLDVSMVTVIAVLTALVVLLLLRGR